MKVKRANENKSKATPRKRLLSGDKENPSTSKFKKVLKKVANPSVKDALKKVSKPSLKNALKNVTNTIKAIGSKSSFKSYSNKTYGRDEAFELLLDQSTISNPVNDQPAASSNSLWEDTEPADGYSLFEPAMERSTVNRTSKVYDSSSRKKLRKSLVPNSLPKELLPKSPFVRQKEEHEEKLNAWADSFTAEIDEAFNFPLVIVSEKH